MNRKKIETKIERQTARLFLVNFFDFAINELYLINARIVEHENFINYGLSVQGEDLKTT